MPCGISESEQAQINSERRAQLEKRIDKLTQLLCLACKYIEKHQRHLIEKAPTPVTKWWTKHKKLDSFREKEERARRLEDVKEAKRRVSDAYGKLEEARSYLRMTTKEVVKTAPTKREKALAYAEKLFNELPLDMTPINRAKQADACYLKACKKFGIKPRLKSP